MVKEYFKQLGKDLMDLPTLGKILGILTFCPAFALVVGYSFKFIVEHI